MTKRSTNEEKDTTVNVSKASLDIKDVAVILAVIVSITLAWSAFSTRVAILERELVTLHSTISELKAQVKDMQIEQQRTKSTVNEHDMIVEQLLRDPALGKPAPRRSTKEQADR